MTAARRRLLLANGVFLVVVGGVQVVFELLAYYAGAVAARDARRFWHVLAAAVHTLLGTANVLFWDSFVVFGMVPMGIAATVVHFVLVAAHIGALVASREPTSA